MTNHVTEDDNTLTMVNDTSSIEVYSSYTNKPVKFVNRDLVITVEQEYMYDTGYETHRAEFRLSDSEATQLKEFLIKKGY